jgi:hypothetical protein
VPAISKEDDFVRPDLPPRYDQDDEDYPRRYRRRFDARGEWSRDEEHLRILSILHYVLGGLSGLYCSFPLFHIFMGALMVSGAIPSPDPEQAVVGWFFIGIGSAFVLLGWIYAACTLYAGYCLSRRARYMYCFVMACLSCVNMPLGTVLGVFTIVVLARPGVKELFDRAPAEPRPVVEE